MYFSLSIVLNISHQTINRDEHYKWITFDFIIIVIHKQMPPSVRENVHESLEREAQEELDWKLQNIMHVDWCSFKFRAGKWGSCPSKNSRSSSFLWKFYSFTVRLKKIVLRIIDQNFYSARSKSTKVMGFSCRGSRATYSLKLFIRWNKFNKGVKCYNSNSLSLQ